MEKVLEEWVEKGGIWLSLVKRNSEPSIANKRAGNFPSKGYQPPLLSEGTYGAQCTGYEISTNAAFGKLQTKIYVWFFLFSHSGEEKFLCKCMNYPAGVVSKRSEYYDFWVTVNEQSPRDRKLNSMNPEIFLDKIVKVSVKTIVPKDKETKEDKPVSFHYSKVHRVISVGP